MNIFKFSTSIKKDRYKMQSHILIDFLFVWTCEEKNGRIWQTAYLRIFDKHT